VAYAAGLPDRRVGSATVELGTITGTELRAGLDGDITDEQMTAALGDLQRRHRVTYKHALGTGIGALHDIRSTRS
jgi:hypothetical protein